MDWTLRERLFALRLKYRHHVDFVNTFNQLLEIEKLSKEELAILNFNRAKDILKYAYNHSTFYKEIYDKSGFTPEDIRTPDDWEQVPIITKQDLRENFDKIVIKENLKFCHVSSTGGSTGTPLKVIKDSRNNDWAIFARALGRFNISFASNKAIVGRNVTPNSLTNKFLSTIYHYPTKIITLNAESISEKEINDFVKEINKTKPRYIQGYVGTILNIARFIINKQLNVHPIDLAWVTSAPISNIEKDIIRKAFKGDVMDQYGSVEICSIAFESPEHNGLYVTDDFRKIEIVDENNTTLPYDVYGNVVVTDFANHCFPLIRYKNGDRTKIIGRGGKLPYTLLAPIKGRVSDYILTPSNTIISGEYLTTIFDDFPDFILAFQVHQKKNYDISVLYVQNTQKDNKETERIINTVKNKLTNFTNNEINISFIKVESIPDDRGKTRYVINDIISNYQNYKSV